LQVSSYTGEKLPASSKEVEFSANRQPVYDFLLVINSNLGLILHRYWDTASFWPKFANFAHPPLI